MLRLSSRRRYYGGCEYIDIAEQLAIGRANKFWRRACQCSLIQGLKQHCMYHACLIQGDTMDLNPPSPASIPTTQREFNVSGHFYKIVVIRLIVVSRIDMDEVEREF